MSWQVKITVLRAGRPYFSAALDRAPITIGAHPQNDVVLIDPVVSGEHAVVLISRSELVVHDRSSNGTFYEGHRMREINLGQGGRIAIPPFELDLTLEIDERIWKTALHSHVLHHLPPPPIMDDTVTRRESEPTPPPLPPLPPLPPPPREPTSPPSPPPPPATPPPTRSGPTATTPQLEPAETAPSGPDATLLAPIVTAGHDAFVLQVVQGPEELLGRIFALPPKPAILGRSETAEVSLPMTTVSRQHARLEPLGGGRFLLTDLGSSNGCFVDGQRVENAELGEGDRLQLADVVFLLGQSRPEHDPVRQTTPRKAVPPTRSAALVSSVEARPAEGNPTLVFVEVVGRIDNDNYTQLADTLDRAISDGGRFLVVDLGRVEFLSHTGLGALVKAVTRLRSLRGEMYLVALSERLHAAISLSHLEGLFGERLFDTRDQALAAWRSKHWRS